jgi:hypothetical protein
MPSYPTFVHIRPGALAYVRVADDGAVHLWTDDTAGNDTCLIFESTEDFMEWLSRVEQPMPDPQPSARELEPESWPENER